MLGERACLHHTLDADLVLLLQLLAQSCNEPIYLGVIGFTLILRQAQHVAVVIPDLRIGERHPPSPPRNVEIVATAFPPAATPHADG
ncbi:hypothetical protein D9M71_761790 [compost metagenome]